MNSRPTSEEAPSTRHSTRSRYSIPTYDPNTADASRVSSSKSTLKSKSGINGRDYEDDDLLTTSTDRSVRRNRSGDRSAKSSLDELEKDFALARSGSNVSKGREHPWKSPSSSGDALDNNNASSSSSPGNNTFATNDRWVPDSDYANQSREATSNAVVEMATKFADIEADRFDDASFAPMGGVKGSGELQDDKDYVKGRLSSLLLSPEGRDSTNYRRETGRLVHSAPAKSEESEHDRVRNQAMKMLRIADSLDSNSGSASPTRDPDNKVTGLFRTSTGGLSMRQLEDDEVSFLKKKRTNASLAGIERYGKESVPRVNSIKSGDEYDLPYSQHSADDEYADSETPNTSRSSSWSSRYSVERQLMAITGGLDSTRILNKMDNLNMSRQKTKSARGMYRSSAAAMDGSGEEYGDYTKAYSTTGGGIGGVWNYIKGTLWSDLTEINYDGTTQSLVRREKRKVKRRRIMMGLVGLVALCITIGVLVVKGNPKPSFARSSASAGGTVNFYVLSDEPYDLSNVRQLTRELENLPSDAEFLIHLGNANGNSQSRCQEYGYERAASILKESPVPTFVIPGDRDWVKCSKPSRALEWWSQNLGMFDKRFEESKKFNVAHQDGGENFAFVHKGVLFLSVHIVDTETNASEWTSRHERNVMWTKEQLNKDGYRSVVIFGHAPPSSKQGEYFWPIIDQLKDTNIPVLYLHANTEGGEFEEYHPYGEAENFEAVQLEKKGVEAPMRVTVWGNKRKQNNMFEFTRRNHDGTPAGYDAES